MAKKSRYFLLIMEFMDHLVNELGYYVTNTPNSVAEIHTKLGYGKPRQDGEPESAVKFNFEIVQLSRNEVETYVDRVALVQEGEEFGESTEEIKTILLKYFDDFVEEHFIYKNVDTDRQVKLHKGYRPKRRKDGSHPLSKYSVAFTSVQPSREEIEKHISFFIAEYLRK